MSRLLLILLLSVSLSAPIFSQNADCEQTLNLAAAEFEAGRFYGLPSILKSCLEKGFSQEQKVRAYLLLTQVYLILDDPLAAEGSYLKLLQADPEYVANPAHDPIDVYYLSKKFTATPILTPHFQLGLNTSLQRVIYDNNTSSTPNQVATSKIFKLGYQLGGGLDWNITNRWSIGVGAAFSNKNFKTIVDDKNLYNRLTAVEKQSWFDFPVMLKYSADSGKIRPFFYGGLAANLLVGAKVTLDMNHQIDFSSTNVGVSQGPDAIITNKRNFFNRSIVLGGGAKYKIGKNFLYVDVCYMAGLTNLTKNIYRASDGKFDPLLAQYGYASNSFRLDNVSISFGYIKPLYDPRKKKRVVRSLLEKVGLKKVSK